MCGLGPMEIVIIIVLLFLVFKTKKLPEMIQAFGKGIIEFKKATKESPEEPDAGVDSKHPKQNEPQSEGKEQTTNEAKPEETKEG
jgi:sec-independent protein translocase protein TatA